MKMDTLISSLVPPVFEKSSRANSRKRRNRKTFTRNAKAPYTNKHTANARSSGLSTRSTNRNSSAFNNVPQKFKNKGANNGKASNVSTAKDSHLHSIALQQIRSSSSSKRGPPAPGRVSNAASATNAASTSASSVSSSSSSSLTASAAERHKMYFSAFDTNSSSAIVTSHSHSQRSSSNSTDARLSAYQRELEGKNKTFSGYPPSHARGLNDATANRAARKPAAGFAPSGGGSNMAIVSDQGQGGIPPRPPLPAMSGVPPPQPVTTFYQTGGHPQAVQAAAPQQVMYPSHGSYVTNTYEQYTGAMLAANQAAVAAAAMRHPHTWSAAASMVPAAAASMGIPAPNGGMTYVASQGQLNAPQHAARSSFIVLPDENTRPPHSFAFSVAQNAAGSASSLGAKASTSDASLLHHPLAQNPNVPSQHQLELGPYTRPLPLNPKQVAARNAPQSLSMPVPNCVAVTDENSAFSGNYAQPQSTSVPKSKSSDAPMRQAGVHIPNVNPECQLRIRGLDPECASKSVEEADAGGQATMADEADAVAQMAVEKAAPVARVSVPPVRAKRPVGGRTMSAEQLANDCDLFFDSDEILAGMRQSEKEYAPLVLKDYMSVQKSLNNRMRLIVIDWLFEVEQEYSLDDRTMFLAVNYLDRFLSQVHLRRDQLQLVGTTCLYLASKFQEIDPPSAAQYTFIADKTFSIDQLFQMETCILDVLSFRLCATTSYDFLLTFMMKLELPQKAERFALYLLSLFVESVNYGRFLPSQEAAAAIYLTKLNIFGDDSWTAEHEHVTGYSLDHLKEVVKLYDAMHRTQYEHFVKHFLFDRGAPGHAVSDKFASTHYEEVSKVIAPLNYAGPRVTQPCDPRELREGTIRCRCPRPKCQPLR